MTQPPYPNQPPPAGGPPYPGGPPVYGGQQPPAYGGQQPPAYGGQQPPTYGGQQPPAYGGPPSYPPTPQTMGPQTTRMARIDPGPSYTFGAVGAIVAAVGLIVGIVSFTALDWISVVGQSTKFGDLRDLVDSVSGSASLPGDTEIYFKWLGWVLLIGSFAIALLACLPTPASTALRIIGLLAGLAGIVLTFWAIKGNDSFSTVFDNASVGLWLALVAFLLIGLGAVAGPQRSRY